MKPKRTLADELDDLYMSPEDRAGFLAEAVLTGEASRTDLAELRRLCRGNARCTDAAVFELLVWAAPIDWARLARGAVRPGSLAA